MDEQELFTVNVFQSRDRQSVNETSSDEPSRDVDNDVSLVPMGQFQNMVSARLIKGRALELEHSNLAGPEVKFKTVINYERTLAHKSFLGVTFSPQDGYITKTE